MKAARARPRRDGLIGLTRREREIIAERIARVRTAKRSVHGAELMPSLLRMVLDSPRAPVIIPPVDAGRRCARCKQRRPTTEFHVRSNGSLYSYCYACERRRHADNARDRRKPGDPAMLALLAEQARERRRKARESGMPCVKSGRQKLMDYRSKSRQRLKNITDPASRARVEAHIRELTEQIEHIDREVFV